MPFPVEEKYVTETEEKLGLTFPESYRQKMMRENGGEFEVEEDNWQLYPIFDSSDKKRIKRTCNDVIHETESAREWRNFPQDAIAIGGNGGGDQLILLPPEEPGVLSDAVYWWDHETGEVHKIADDFGEL